MKPVLVFDGDCGFCRHWVARLKRTVGPAVEYAPYQEAAGDFPQIPKERFEGAIQLILPSGEAVSGAKAVFQTLAFVPGKGKLLWMYRHFPGFGRLSEAAYRWAAGHRPLLSSLIRWRSS